ncbi:MAG: amino acid ABC transporter permease [Desulfurococcaceae archaeon]
MSLIEQTLVAFIVIVRYGLANTILVSTLAFFLGLALGLILVFVQVLGGRLASSTVDSIVVILRGIPPVLLLFIIFYGLPSIGIKLNNVVSAIIGLGLISSAYQSQVLRSSIETVAARQMEAALSIGLSKWSTYTSVVFPQALRLSLPGLINEYTIILKDSSLAYAIGVVEAFTQAVHIAQARLEYFSPLIAVALIYLLICFSLSQIINYIYLKLRVLGYGQ